MQRRESLTTTEKLVCASMKELGQNGVTEVTGRQLAEVTQTHKQTVRRCLRTFVSKEWVEASPSVDPSGSHNPTIYRLASDAPAFSALLVIEALQ